MNLRLIRLNLLELHKNQKDKSFYDMVQAILVLCVWPMNKYVQSTDKDNSEYGSTKT